MWIAVFVALKISACSNSWKIRYYMRITDDLLKVALFIHNVTQAIFFSLVAC